MDPNSPEINAVNGKQLLDILSPKGPDPSERIRILDITDNKIVGSDNKPLPRTMEIRYTLSKAEHQITENSPKILDESGHEIKILPGAVYIQEASEEMFQDGTYGMRSFRDGGAKVRSFLFIPQEDGTLVSYQIDGKLGNGSSLKKSEGDASNDKEGNMGARKSSRIDERLANKILQDINMASVNK